MTGHGVANCSSVLLDTEANVHIFCNKELLTNLRPINQNGDSSLFNVGIVRGEEIRVPTSVTRDLLKTCYTDQMR